MPPTQLTILDNDGGVMIDNRIGPYGEGVNINITCMSSGGVPPPRVSWWKEHALLDDGFQVLADGTVKNILHLSKLTRKDLDAVSVQPFIFIPFSTYVNFVCWSGGRCRDHRPVTLDFHPPLPYPHRTLTDG